MPCKAVASSIPAASKLPSKVALSAALSPISRNTAPLFCSDALRSSTLTPVRCDTDVSTPSMSPASLASKPKALSTC